MLAALVAAATLVGSGPAVGQAAAGAPVVKPGDILRITVWRQPEFSGDFSVAPDGTIVHPLYKEIAVGGLPLSTVQSRIDGFLRRFDVNPNFVVQDLMPVVVEGEVRTPGVYTVPAQTSVTILLAQAGGTTDLAR